MVHSLDSFSSPLRCFFYAGRQARTAVTVKGLPLQSKYNLNSFTKPKGLNDLLGSNSPTLHSVPHFYSSVLSAFCNTSHFRGFCTCFSSCGTYPSLYLLLLFPVSLCLGLNVTCAEAFSDYLYQITSIPCYSSVFLESLYRYFFLLSFLSTILLACSGRLPSRYNLNFSRTDNRFSLFVCRVAHPSRGLPQRTSDGDLRTG